MRHPAHSFRPLAGFWFLNVLMELVCREYSEFPSPCGVLVLKYFGEYPNPFENEWFPSPCGVLVLKLFKYLVGGLVAVFPSPCGVLVLKSFGKAVDFKALPFPSPCGVLVLKYMNKVAEMLDANKVSVPLRGSGS